MAEKKTIIINADQTMTIPIGLTLGVTGDNGTNSLYFEAPLNPSDMIKLTDCELVYFVYVTPNGNGSREPYIVSDIADVDGEKITFSVPITAGMTEYKGNVGIGLCFKHNDQDWNVEANFIPCMSGYHVDNPIANYPDIVQQIMAYVKDGGELLTQMQNERKDLIELIANGNAVIGKVGLLESETEQLIEDNKNAVAAANTATNAANTATGRANTAATDAEEATLNANAATNAANTATEGANAAAGAANTATEGANAAAGAANTAAGAANTAAEEANTAADAANAATNAANTATEKATAATSNANTATTRANLAADSAEDASDRAEAAALACENIVIEQNTMVDTITHVSCVMTLENGIICLREA